MTAVICVNCELDMKPILTGAFVEEMAGDKPYKLYSGDAYECPECGARVVTRFGIRPIAEHFQLNYQERSKERFCRAYQRGEYKPGKAADSIGLWPQRTGPVRRGERT